MSNPHFNMAPTPEPKRRQIVGTFNDMRLQPAEFRRLAGLAKQCGYNSVHDFVKAIMPDVVRYEDE